MRRQYLVLLLQLFLPAFAFSQTGNSGAYTLRLDLPLFDLPYQINATGAMGHGFFSTYASLSMSQSLAVSVDLYSAMHFGMRKLYDHLTFEPVWKNTKKPVRFHRLFFVIFWRFR
jgi:hypothetical protein